MLLGSDVTGRPILDFVLMGARNTFLASILGVAIAVALGFLIVPVKRSRRPWLAAAVDFVVDLGLLIPFLPVIALVVVFAGGGNPWGIAALLGVLGTPLAAVLIDQRADAGADSFSRSRLDLIARRPVGTTGRVVRAATILSICFVLVSSTIDFLGIGARSSNPSWGNALTDVLNYLGFGYWWWVLFPGLILVLTLLALIVTGAALLDSCESAALKGKNLSPQVRHP
jgi:ABC-type dipeptide/oligopeptide/nickel transport system permease subunit